MGAEGKKKEGSASQRRELRDRTSSKYKGPGVEIDRELPKSSEDTRYGGRQEARGRGSGQK